MKNNIYIRIFILCILASCAGCGKEHETSKPEEILVSVENDSNTFSEPLPVPEGRKIEEQCFDVELESFGTVTFTSYAPDTEVQEMGDVLFGLEKEGALIYQFPFVMEGNRRPLQSFFKIQEISFQDYDTDGHEDLLILVEYRTLTYREENNTITEIRLYRNQSEQGDYILDTERMNVLNRNQWNHSVREAMEHMGDVGKRLLLDYLEDLAEEVDSSG